MKTRRNEDGVEFLLEEVAKPCKKTGGPLNVYNTRITNNYYTPPWLYNELNARLDAFKAIWGG
jgi:hypothetical protein